MALWEIPQGGRKKRRSVLISFRSHLFGLVFLIPYLCASTTRGVEIALSPDSDVSLVHFPTKLIDDLPNLFIRENIPPFAVGSLATALDWSTLDGQNTLAADLQNWKTQPFFDFGNFYGEGWVEGGIGLGGWGLGAWTQDLKWQEFGRDVTEALVDSTFVVTGLKYVVGRERPDGSNNQSFPSGHSITAFCFAPVVTRYWGWEAGVPAYLLATVTGLARVEGYHHYLSDVVAGATLGVIIGNAVVYTPKDIPISLGPGQVRLTWKFN
jgi:membrane-associated phospholipid phosphatase